MHNFNLNLPTSVDLEKKKKSLEKSCKIMIHVGAVIQGFNQSNFCVVAR